MPYQRQAEVVLAGLRGVERELESTRTWLARGCFPASDSRAAPQRIRSAWSRTCRGTEGRSRLRCPNNLDRSAMTDPEKRERAALDVLALLPGVREGAPTIRRGVMTSTDHDEACLARTATTCRNRHLWVRHQDERRRFERFRKASTNEHRESGGTADLADDGPLLSRRAGTTAGCGSPTGARKRSSPSISRATSEVIARVPSLPVLHRLAARRRLLIVVGERAAAPAPGARRIAGDPCRPGRPVRAPVERDRRRRPRQRLRQQHRLRLPGGRVRPGHRRPGHAGRRRLARWPTASRSPTAWR